MDIQGKHKFTVTYDDAMVQDAIRTFVWRRAFAEQSVMWITAVLLAISSTYFLIWGGAGWMAGVMLTLAFVPLIFVAATWRAHHVNTYGRYKRMGEPKAVITVDGEGIDVVSDLGTGMMTWRNITEIWERPDAFMIFCDPAAFNILPRKTMPAEVQAFLAASPLKR